MNNYTARDIQSFFDSYNEHITHIVVAHTNFRPYRASQVQIERMTTQAKSDCRYSLNCFDKLLYPYETNKPTRYPLVFRPLRFVTIEGANGNLGKEQTIHFNIALGNLPVDFCPAVLKFVFERAWVDKAGQSDDIEAYRVAHTSRTESTWNGYSLKEAQQQTSKAWRIDGVWDVENCWIPHKALNTDLS